MKNKSKSPEETKERILNAAQYLFVKKGYFNTSIPDIVNESGISIGSVYHHFTNKQSLAEQLYVQVTNSVVYDLEKITNSFPEIKDQLKAIVTYMLKLADKEPIKLEYMLFINHEQIHEQFVPICLSKPFIVVKQIIDEGIKECILDDLPVELMAGGFIGIPLRIIEMKLKKVIDYSLESRSEEIFQMCWKAIYTS